MNRAVICVAAVLISFTSVHSCSINDPTERSYAIEEETEETQRRLKQSAIDAVPYLRESLEKEEAAKNESDSSLLDDFIAGTAAAGIWGIILWAINKHKNRK